MLRYFLALKIQRNYVTRNAPEKSRDFQETGPSWTITRGLTLLSFTMNATEKVTIQDTNDRVHSLMRLVERMRCCRFVNVGSHQWHNDHIVARHVYIVYVVERKPKNQPCWQDLSFSFCLMQKSTPSEVLWTKIVGKYDGGVIIMQRVWLVVVKRETSALRRCANL